MGYYQLFPVVLLAFGLFVGCGSETTPTGPPTPPPPTTPSGDTSTNPPDTNPPSGEVEDTNPSVKILAIQGLESYPGLLCANEQTVLVAAKNIGSKSLRMTLRIDGFDTFVEPTVEAADEPNQFRLTFDFATHLEGVEDAQLPTIKEGMDVTLLVAAMDEGQETLPTDLKLYDTADYTIDATAPTIEVMKPDLTLDLVPVAGFLELQGKVVDNRQVAGLSVAWSGNPLEAVVPKAEAEVSKEWNFELSFDVRDLESGTGELGVIGRDACGYQATVLATAKAIRWPRIRKHRVYELPLSNAAILEIKPVEYNGDDYPDLLIASTKGVFIAENNNDAALIDKPRFQNYPQLTSALTERAHMVDIDGDGDLDLIAVEKAAGKYQLAVYRRLEEEQLESVEVKPLNLAPGTKVTGMAVTDFTRNYAQAPDGAARDDVVIATDNEDEAIILFKRQHADQPQDFDQCTETFVEAEVEGDAGVDGGEVAGEMVTVCPTLYAPAVKASGVNKITHLVAADITGIDGSEPDGYPEVIVGADDANQILVFANRFGDSGLIDTAFTDPTISYAWLSPTAKTARARFFCLGNFIDKEGGDDPMDLVVGTENFGTWRVLEGGGPLGKFLNETLDPESLDVKAMVGTTGTDITGLTCGDFNLDGKADFAITSNSSSLLQVHLGDGNGRFNQLDDDPLLNPVNEAIGFVTQKGARNPFTVDLDFDLLPDFIMDHGDNSFAVYKNLSSAPTGFDLHGIRTLITPLGKYGSGSGGGIKAMGVGDVTGDGLLDIVAVSSAIKQPTGTWLEMHPTANAYRAWNVADSKPTKVGNGNMFYVWRAGENGPHTPSYPAAYDYVTAGQYAGLDKEHAPVTPFDLKLYDVAGPGGNAPDEVLDIVMVGSKSSGSVTSHVSVLINTSQGDFWNTDKLTTYKDSMFEPLKGLLSLGESPKAFEFIGKEDIPSMMIVTSPMGNEGACVGRTVRICPWNENPVEEGANPYWDCPTYFCGEFPGRKVGGPAVDMARVAKIGPDAGSTTEDPTNGADTVVVHEQTNSLSFLRHNGEPDYPFDPITEKAVGAGPQSMDLGDIDGDGVADLVVAISNNVYISFGQPGAEPFVAPKPIDLTQNHKGLKKVSIVDVNADGWNDVVFLLGASRKLMVYLNAGIEQQGQNKQHVFHGPTEIPLCNGPAQIIPAAFDPSPAKAACKDLVIMCTSGAIAMVRNEACP